MKKLNLVYAILCIVLFLVLFILTLLRQERPFWDEAYYLENVLILGELGFSKEFLMNYKGPAGPTYAVIHYVLNPITNLQAPYVRLVNVAFFLFSMIILYLTFQQIRQGNEKNIVLALSTLSIPTVYMIAGMALTEMFAAFFLSIFIYLLVYAFNKQKNSWILAISAGLSLSLAILARQPILLILLAFPLLFIDYQNRLRINQISKEFTIFLCVSFSVSLIIPILVFSIWQNIQPPSTITTGKGLAPKHLILALGYSALYVFFINPTFFNLKRDCSKKELTIGLLIIFLLNIFLLKVSYTPFATIIARIIPNSFIPTYSVVCGSLLTALGLFFLYYFMKKQFLTCDKMIIFLSLSFLLIIATSIKVTHQFSARYVAQAFPLLILAVNAGREKMNMADIVTLFLGGFLGILSLESYFVSDQ